ncbi:MAG: polyprenyl synthetase family protein [Candidatus Micrarchaeia archaeon]
MLGISELKKRISEKVIDVEKTMLHIMPNREPASVYELAWDFLNRGGKRIRPYLLLTSVEAFNGNPEDALEIAAGIEIFHNFTLVHDDIEDNSEMRRGKPCLHISYGIPLAINAGDGMFAHVFKSLKESRLTPYQKDRIIGMFAEAFIGVVDGQGYEIGWIENNMWDISEKMYLDMAGGKTGDLMGACTQIGSFIGGASERDMEEMRLFGYEIGLAFQIQDDVLNLVGEEEKYKKEIGGDIREGKRTLIVIKALERLGENEKRELISILAKKENTHEEIVRAIELMKGCGAIDYAKEYAERLVASAKNRLSVVKNAEKKEELEAIADMFIKREA